MPCVSDLPPELLLKVFSQLGNGSSYSDRERQRDLAGVAKVCRRFYATVIPVLLYGDTIQVRSAGRSHCLARTLEADPALAASVRDLVAAPCADQAHAPSALVLLRTTPNLVALTLGEALFHRLDEPHMRAALAAKALRRFSFGFGNGEPARTSVVELAPFLAGWTALEHLELHGVPPDDQVGRVAGAARGLAASGIVPPTYHLAHLEVHGVEGWHSRSAWSLGALDWVLGRSHALTSLALVNVTCGFALPTLFDELVCRGCASTLLRLTLRRIPSARHLSPRLFDPNDLGTWFPSLTHLSLQDEPRSPICAAPSPAFRPSSSLRVLELHGRWPKHGFNLMRMLEDDVETSDGGQASLAKIKVVGLSPTNADVKELSAACRRRGIVFELAWSFSGSRALS
ncbi:hypothetical protein JCM8208_000857 [Rhodotorula glutinis]